MTRHVTTRVQRLSDGKVFSGARGAALNAFFGNLGLGSIVYLHDIPRGRYKHDSNDDFGFGLITQHEYDIQHCCDGYLPFASPEQVAYRWIFDAPPRGLVYEHYPELEPRYRTSSKRRKKFAQNAIRRALFQWLSEHQDTASQPRSAAQILLEMQDMLITPDFTTLNESRLAPRPFQLQTSASGISRHIESWREQYERGWGLEIGNLSTHKTFAFKFSASPKYIRGFQMMDSLVEYPRGLKHPHQKPVIRLNDGRIENSIKKMATVSNVSARKVMHNCEGDVHSVEVRDKTMIYVFKYLFEIEDFMNPTNVDEVMRLAHPKNFHLLDAMDLEFTKVPEEQNA